MIQKTLITNKLDELTAFTERLKYDPTYQNASDKILLMSVQEDDEARLAGQIELIRSTLPDLRIVGATMPEVGVMPEYGSAFRGGGYSFLLFERAKVDVFHYDCTSLSAQQAGRKFKREVRYREHVAGIMLFSAGLEREIDRFLISLAKGDRSDIPVIGAQAEATHQPYIFGDFGVDGCGVVAMVFSGRGLQMHYHYDMGWRAIGKEMRVTGIDGHYCATTIDGKPAVSIYQQYLGVEPDDYFVENVREFPLITMRGDREVVRCPSGYDEGGKLKFIARINEGDTVRLSYGNPRRLLEDTKHYADSMRQFAPQALFLVICENRARFMGDLAASDINDYRSFAAQTAWVRGFAAIMIDRYGGGVVNSAIVSVGMREGAPDGMTAQARPIFVDAPQRKGAIPLDQRLAMFLERTTRELEDMALAADTANAAKSSFLSNMSHEIRTPINAVLGMNEMILRESDKESVQNYAQSIHVAGMSLLSIINDVLDFSKIEAGKMDITPDRYELPSLINDLVNLFRLRAEEKGLTFSVEVNPHIPHLLYGDEMRIKQIMTNLLSNAVKYTEKGTVELAVEYRRTGAEEIALAVSVEDTGIGIKKRDMDKLFSAFDRLDKESTRKIEGTGLGLNIAQQLLSLMDSKLSVVSSYGEGSKFSFTLKQKVLDWKEIGDYRVSSKSMERMRSRGNLHFTAPDARILVVDDAPMNLDVIAGLLKRTQIAVDTAKSGPECLEKFVQAEYDMIFLDHRMPGMDGIETLEHLRDDYGVRLFDTPIVCLTANAVFGAREKYIQAGFTDYLTKPVMPDELESMLLKYLPEEKVILPVADGLAEDEEEADSLPQWIAEIEALDTEKGIAYCGGVPEYLDALRIFGKSISQRADEIENAVRETDWAGYTLKVHALKSMSKSVGATGLSYLAQNLENAGDAGDTETIRTMTGQLLSVYRNIEQALKPLTETENKEQETAEDNKPLLSEAEWEDALASIRDLAESFDHESIGMVMDMLDGYRIPDGQKEDYDLLQKAVDNMDWDTIGQLVGETGK